MSDKVMAAPAVDAAEEVEKYDWAIDEAIKTAEAAGFEVIRSAETTLLLDLDNGAAVDTYKRMMRSLGGAFGLKELRRWASKSGNTHVVVSCKPLSFPERVALQACLGSDPIREGLAIAMAADGEDNPSILFKPASAPKTRGEDYQF